MAIQNCFCRNITGADTAIINFVTWNYGVVSLNCFLGSASGVTDTSGNILGENRCYPYGETHLSTGTIYTDGTFIGQRDCTSDFGLLFFNARWVDVSTGRFAQADTIIPQGQGVQAWDRYAFVNNNPVRYTDPSGHMMDDRDDGGCVGGLDCAFSDDTLPTPQLDPSPSNGDTDESSEFAVDCSDPSWGCVTDVGGTWEDPAVYISLAFGGWASGLYKTTGIGMYSMCIRILACARVVAGTTGITVYRVWGGKAGPVGGIPVVRPGSWTPINPLTIVDYANKAGLPPGNTAQYLSIGTVYTMENVSIVSATKIGPNAGGLLEYVMTNPQIQVFIQEVQYLFK